LTSTSSFVFSGDVQSFSPKKPLVNEAYWKLKIFRLHHEIKTSCIEN
jgi:hypothetical protein